MQETYQYVSITYQYVSIFQKSQSPLCRAGAFFGRREYKHRENENQWNNFESILQALKKFIKIGKIRYIGMSNETPYGLSKYLELSKVTLPNLTSFELMPNWHIFIFS